MFFSQTKGDSIFKLKRIDSTVFDGFYYFEFENSNGKIKVISYKNEIKYDNICYEYFKKNKKYYLKFFQIWSVILEDSIYIDFQKMGLSSEDRKTKIGGPNREPTYECKNIFKNKIECDARKKRKVFRIFQQ